MTLVRIQEYYSGTFVIEGKKISTIKKFVYEELNYLHQTSLLDGKLQ